MNSTKRLIILSGPSCVGKSPLVKSLRRAYPEMPFQMPIFYTSRRPRTIEQEGVDYYFRSEKEIRSFPPDRFIVARTRTVWQGIDLEETERLFARHDLIITEVYPTLGTLFLEHPRVRQMSVDFDIQTVFISPATEEEIQAVQTGMGFASPDEATAAIMLPKHISRMQQQGKLLTPEVMDDIHIRAGKAYEEIRMGRSYAHRIINHDGEDSNNWRYTPPIGEAGATLKRFVGILETGETKTSK
jgi:guanylate kinase